MLFQNAKFDDKYMTRDGRKAIFYRYNKYDNPETPYELLVDKWGIASYNSDGEEAPGVYSDLDIISLWGVNTNNAEDSSVNDDFTDNHYYFWDDVDLLRSTRIQ